MKTFDWALIGPGKIARRFAHALSGMPGSRLAAVHGRDPGRAAAFAAECQSSWPDAAGAARVTADLADLLADPSIDAVYIATPHAQHGAPVRAALLAGKPVLCEKPLVPTHAEGEALVALARERGVFLMEAVWTRFLPAYDVLGSWLRRQAIGPLRAIESTFCFPASFDPHSRLFDPALAGGALLDVGIYNLTATRWVMAQALGHIPALQRLDVQGQLAPTGVDLRIQGLLGFEGGVTAQFCCGLDASAPNALTILGEQGSISLPCNFWESQQLVLRPHGQAEQHLDAPWRINGFEGEIEEAQACIRHGLVESPRMTHAESLAILAWMDRIRARVGVRYPFESDTA
jgi:predicted dehydrogenase